MKYLDRLKSAGDEKNALLKDQEPSKLTKPSELLIPDRTKPTIPAFVSSAGAEPAAIKSCEPRSGRGALEARVRAMADRWRYSREELDDALIFATTEPDGALAWVEHDEGVLSPPLSPGQESARAEVLAQLEANRSVLSTFVNRFEPDGTCVVTLAIRGVGTGELKIPADRFNQRTLDDYGALLNTIKGSS
jgi:hypothetical protein